jgi:hypothetical protein
MKLFFHAVADAHDDPFFPCSWPVAVCWTLWHWGFVRSLYS